MRLTLALSLLGLVLSVSGQGGRYTEPNCNGKQVLVHLFEWPFDKIARECEEYLAPKGFCGVQISPPSEHIQGGQWWTRYQPVSYKLESRSGNRQQLEDMVRRCNAVGVNVIADVVLNHMSGHGSSGTGTGGTQFDGDSWSYPGVPYSSLDFHPYCDIMNYQDPYEVRNCYLVGLNDLDGGKDYVRDKIAAFMNDLLSIGIKGFRVDASKHMWPGDLEAIQSRLNTDIDGNVPFLFHEVIDQGNEPITTSEYYGVGKVTEFRTCTWLGCVQGGNYDCLNGFGNGLSDPFHAVSFVDNHDNQRGHGGGGTILNFKSDWNYKLASGFNLAIDYGLKRVMSSYYFEDTDAGPASPMNRCFEDGWICEHRWSSIGNMVQFTNAVVGEPVQNWQLIDGNLGFSRGGKGFFAMGNLFNTRFFTGLPDGDYCDIIHNCQQTITVSGGYANFNKAQANDPVVAICVGCVNIPDPTP